MNKNKTSLGTWVVVGVILLACVTIGLALVQPKPTPQPVDYTSEARKQTDSIKEGLGLPFSLTTIAGLQ